jgi:acyl-coenzyme A synthetase/AMP-(fatty) acid ligase
VTGGGGQVKSAGVNDVAAEYRELETRILAALREDLREAEFDALALEAHAFQKRWNAPYANFCAARPTATHWREIPAVPQSAFKTARLSVAPPGMIARTFRTSGTTGEGYGEHHFINTGLYDAAAVRGWQRLGLGRLPHFMLTPNPWVAPHSSLSHMMATLATRCGEGESYFHIGRDGGLDKSIVRLLWQAQSKAAPVCLLGTALAFLHLFANAECRHFKLPAGSYAMETGGYKGSGREIPKRDLYMMFDEHLGILPKDVINEYGMTELSSQFYTRGLGRPHEGPPWLRAVVIDPETGGEAAVGETGVLRIFDLANLGSVLAVETQDLAVRRERGFELLGRDPAALPRGCSRAADERMRA